MSDKNLNPPSFYENDSEEIETFEEISLENILNHFSVITNKYDRKEIIKAIKIINNYAHEAGVNLYDIQQLLNDIYENI
jgi:hypothetical protein